MRVRRGEALPGLHDVGGVAFNKTGPLTEGRPQRTDLVPAPGFGLPVLAPIAATLRPLAEACCGDDRSDCPIPEDPGRSAGRWARKLPARSGAQGGLFA